MDVLRIFQDYGVDHLTEGHKHCRPGWVNTPCPYCSGNAGYHLGWEMTENYFKCWRCGWHPPVKTLSLLLSLSTKEVLRLIEGYNVLRSYIEKRPARSKPFKVPFGITKLKSIHKQYLKTRGFSVNKLERIWGVQGTGPISYLDELDYRFRLFIPINWNGELVSFDTRDITDKSEAKYKACPTNREKVPRKKILYGNQEAWGDTGICVEGPTDVWKLGESSFAVSGISYKQDQVKEMAKVFKKVAVVFDGAKVKGDERQARRQAKKLVKDLQFRNVEAYIVPINGDPGAMTSQEANRLVKKILNKK